MHMSETVRASAVIVAAGSGTRMNCEESKQYMMLGDRSVLECTLDVFDECDFIDEVVVVLPSQDVELWQKRLCDKAKRYKTVGGGSSRTESSYNGIRATSGDNEIVVIHDGVRPFVTTEQIRSVVAAAHLCGAATLGMRSKDTVKVVDWESARVRSTLNRNEIALIQTPQAFRLGVIKKAYEIALNDNLEYFDDCSLVEDMGISVKLVEGSPVNIKITVPEDMDMARFLMRRGL